MRQYVKKKCGLCGRKFEQVMLKKVTKPICTQCHCVVCAQQMRVKLYSCASMEETIRSYWEIRAWNKAMEGHGKKSVKAWRKLSCKCLMRIEAMKKTN